MTFEEWLPRNRFEDLVYWCGEINEGEYRIDPWDLVDLLKEGWNARYETLTYKDL